MTDTENTVHWLDYPIGFFGSLSREKCLWASTIFLAIATRFYDLGNRVMSYDEAVHAIYALQLYKGEGYVYTPLTHGPFQFLILAITFMLLGVSDAASRVPAACFGVAAVCLLPFFRRYLGRWGALAAGLGLTFSPYLLYYDRYTRNETFIVVWILLTFLAVTRYLETKSDRWLYLLTAVLALQYATKETAYIFAALLGIYLFTRLCLRGIFQKPDKFLRWVRQEPETNLLVVLVITALPLLTALPMTLLNLNPWEGGDPIQKINNPVYWISALGCFMPMLLAAFIIGWIWDRRRFIRVAAIFGGLFLALYSVMFSSPAGWITGIFGSLNYWLMQQGVDRGGQPWYYYLALQIPLYEYLPALLTLLAPIPFLREWNRRQKETRIIERDIIDGKAPLSAPMEIRMMGLLLFWAAGSLAAFSLAGEKMPWLTVHITLPCILIGGWVIERLLAPLSRERITEQGKWKGLILTPILLLTTSWAIGKWLGIHPPFSSLDLDGLQSTSEWITTTLFSLLGWCYLIRLWRKVPFRMSSRIVALAGAGWLFVLTIHTAVAASFTNANAPNEFIYYAQLAPGVRTVMQKMENLAQSNASGSGLRIAYDANTSLAFQWYLRDYPNVQNIGNAFPADIGDTDVVLVSPANWDPAEKELAGGHGHWEGIRIWWPNMDYMHLDAVRIAYAFGDPFYRQALWDIWYYRDFSLYAKLTNEDSIPENWPVSERMRMYTTH